MKTVTGLWIDHRKAIIVILSEKEEKILEIPSNVERQPGRIDGKRSTISFESQRIPADDKQQRAFTKHLSTFYDEVFATISGAESVLIFGPGNAKTELKKIMENHNLHERVVAMESADKMTDHQIAARTRQYFKSLKPV